MHNILEGESLCIDLGSGNPQEGEIQPEGAWILQDIVAHPGVTLVCDIRDLDKHVMIGQCKKIRASHILEHFGTLELPKLFTMFHSLLEKGGELEIHVPNMKWHLALLLEERDEEAVTYLFGGQRDEYDLHKTGFTPMVLYKRLTEAGFKLKKITVEHSIHALATK